VLIFCPSLITGLSKLDWVFRPPARLRPKPPGGARGLEKSAVGASAMTITPPSRQRPSGPPSTSGSGGGGGWQKS